MDVTRQAEFGGTTTTVATNRRALGHVASIRAVLCDLSGTLVDEPYLHNGDNRSRRTWSSGDVVLQFRDVHPSTAGYGVIAQTPLDVINP